MIFNIFVALCLFQVAKTLWRVARKAERKYWEMKEAAKGETHAS